MVLDGKTIVEKPYVYAGPDRPAITEEQIQPNGVDLRVEWVHEIKGTAFLGEDSKMDYSLMKKREASMDDQGFYLLKPYKQYMVDFMEEVSVPEGYCAIIYPRSSLLRVGAFITSALWDTGFNGTLGASVRVLNPLCVKEGARLAQVVFHKAAFNGHRYEGRYQGTNSQSVFIE